MSYRRFAAMIVTSTLVIFALMYLNTYATSHTFFLAIVMIGFMWGMYGNKRLNVGNVAGSVLVSAGALWLVRSLETGDDVAWMKAMIPHHSIAIMTSERAHIRNPRVRVVADRIIDAQIREVAEMKREIARLEARPVPSGAPDLPPYRDRKVPPPAGETSAEAGIDPLAPIR